LLCFVLVLRRFAPKLPAALVAVVAAISTSAALNFCGVRNRNDWAGRRWLAAPGTDGHVQLPRDELEGDSTAPYGVSLVRRNDAYAKRSDISDFCGEALSRGQREYRTVRALGRECRCRAERRVCGEWQPHPNGYGAIRRAQLFSHYSRLILFNWKSSGFVLFTAMLLRNIFHTARGKSNSASFRSLR
jgi:hypothetical protein